MSRKKLPICLPTSTKIREDGYHDVVKTGIPIDLVEGGSHYFLSRHRRFGKGLLLDTLNELFEGNQARFQEPDNSFTHEASRWSMLTQWTPAR